MLSTTLAVGAGLLVLWVIGVATGPAGTSGLTAVGVGIHSILTGFTQIVRGL